MAEKKKTKTVDDIVSDYQKFHHKTGKSFEERIKKFEEFHDSENIHALQFAHQAHYTVFGKPTNLKEFPGAYNEAYKVLDRHISEDEDKINDEDKLTEILETYVDTFLQKAMGEKFKKILSHAENKNLSKKELTELKGQLFGQYCTDKEGHPLNILNDPHIKSLKGKKKIEVIEHLRDISEKIRDSYTGYLQQRAMEGLISEDDRLEMAEYISPIFKRRGWEHKKPHITRSAYEQTAHYANLLEGGEQLKKFGYKMIKEEKKK